ncbi:MAG: hypothetical protein FJ279_21110 [Planctomycetes bacterium]|nr:hypothetical protein [Planctomycetota bacterium]MBM4080536.1 hypothetical protein [Planctomycetota bacterium]
MLQELDQYAAANKVDAAKQPPREAEALSKSLFLAHSTTDTNFSAVCASKRLLSPSRLAELSGTRVNPRSPEAILGTAGYVFLYAAPFCRGSTGCGFLFAHTLESAHREDGVATPFDSGGLLHKKVSRPNPAEPARDFLARHEIPVPEHRDYLQRAMTLLFAKPADYVVGNEPVWPGPIGLTGGDRRRWTHEVRVADQVSIPTGYLQAVFAPIRLMTEGGAIESLVKWCRLEGVDCIPLYTSRADDFETLKRRCVDYILGKLLP